MFFAEYFLDCDAIKDSCDERSMNLTSNIPVTHMYNYMIKKNIFREIMHFKFYGLSLSTE